MEGGMEKKYRVTITADRLKGVCPLYKPGQKVGELYWWYFDADRSTHLCAHAVCSMLTAIIPFSRGVSASEMGFGKEDDVCYVQCPDPGPPYTCGGTVVFRLERERIED
jgi:uncharacterized repeat protein (TIGR04076 family)